MLREFTEKEKNYMTFLAERMIKEYNLIDNNLTRLLCVSLSLSTNNYNSKHILQNNYLVLKLLDNIDKTNLPKCKYVKKDYRKSVNKSGGFTLNTYIGDDTFYELVTPIFTMIFRLEKNNNYDYNSDTLTNRHLYNNNLLRVYNDIKDINVKMKNYNIINVPDGKTYNIDYNKNDILYCDEIDDNRIVFPRNEEELKEH